MIKIGECSKCKKEYDPEAFRVKIPNGCGGFFPHPYWSYLCQSCARGEGCTIIKLEREPDPMPARFG